jgi:hypothetical protein
VRFEDIYGRAPCETVGAAAALSEMVKELPAC